MADEMQVTLPEGVLKPIIQAQVVAALNGNQRLIEDMVAFVMSQKVRDQQTYRDMPFLELTCRRVLQSAIEDAVKEWVQTQKPAIKKAIEAQLRRNLSGMAGRIVDGILTASGFALRMKVEFEENR